MTGLWDTTINPESKNSPIDPPWKVLGKKKGDVIEWFQKTLPILEDLSEFRIQTHVNNLLWYTGDFDKTLEYRLVVPGRGETIVPRKIIPRVFLHLFDLTEQRVSKLSALKPTFEAEPTNREQSDRDVTRLMNLCLKAYERRARMDYQIQGLERWNAVFGEVGFGIEWDPSLGDKKSKDSIERVGDVTAYIKEPWTWLPQPRAQMSDVKWGIDLWKIMHIEEARAKFKKPNLEPDGKTFIYGFNQDIQEKREDEVVVYRIIVLPHEFLPDGAMIYIVNNTIVDELEEYPYSHGGFPWEWHTDIDVPGQQFPISAYKHIKPIQHLHNRLTSMIARNITMVGHPHVIMPKGAAKQEAFGNAPTMIEYNGPVEPKIVTFPSVPSEMFEFRQNCRQEMEQIYGIQGVSRGAPPSGVRATSMLKFFEEQEQQRASTQISKHNDLIQRIYLKAASVMGDYYPVEDGEDRLIRTVGKDNEYLIESLKGVKFASEYDVIIKNGTGFSESKAGRLEEIKLIQEMSPGLLSTQQIADVLELGNAPKVYDIVTISLRKAEDENERFLNGAEVLPAEAHEDLIVIWRTRMILANSMTWKYSISKKIKERFEIYMRHLERLMEEKAKVNVKFSQELAQLSYYPAFWAPTPLPPQAPQVSAPAPAAALPEQAPMDMPVPAGESMMLPENLPPPEFLSQNNGSLPVA